MQALEKKKSRNQQQQIIFQHFSGKAAIFDLKSVKTGKNWSNWSKLVKNGQKWSKSGSKRHEFVIFFFHIFVPKCKFILTYIHVSEFLHFTLCI